MTMPIGSAEEPTEVETEYQSEPIRVVSTGRHKDIGAEFGQWRTYLIQNVVWPQNSATPGAVRICNRSLRRKRLLIRVNPVVAGGQVVQVSGSQTSPGAGTIITSIPNASLLAKSPQGTIWNTAWTAILSGTLAAGDANNMQLAMPLGTTQEVGVFPGAAGTYPQPAVPLNPAPGQNISVVATAASTVGAVYQAQIVATAQPQQATDGVILGSREFINNSAQAQQNPFSGAMVGGGFLNINDSVRWECQQELWACFPVSNAAPVLITVSDEMYASDPMDDAFAPRGSH